MIAPPGPHKIPERALGTHYVDVRHLLHVADYSRS
jgi:hypothetical protein